MVVVVVVFLVVWVCVGYACVPVCRSGLYMIQIPTIPPTNNPKPKPPIQNPKTTNRLGL